MSHGLRRLVDIRFGMIDLKQAWLNKAVFALAIVIAIKGNKCQIGTLCNRFKNVFKSCCDENASVLREIVMVISEKALQERHFPAMYPQLCVYLSKEVSTLFERVEDVDGEEKTQETSFKRNFKRVLLNKCQEEFAKGCTYPAELDIEGKTAKVSRHVQKWRRLGSCVRFLPMGELYMVGFLCDYIMHECMYILMRSQLEEIEEGCVLLTTIGKKLDHDREHAIHIMAVYSPRGKFGLKTDLKRT